jgi:hypothetical protein
MGHLTEYIHVHAGRRTFGEFGSDEGAGRAVGSKKPLSGGSGVDNDNGSEDGGDEGSQTHEESEDEMYNDEYLTNEERERRKLGELENN